MSEKSKKWCKDIYDQFLDGVGSMDTGEEVRECEDYIVAWLFCDGMEPLIRSGLLKNVSSYELSKALAYVLEKQNKAT